MPFIYTVKVLFERNSNKYLTEKITAKNRKDLDVVMLSRTYNLDPTNQYKIFSPTGFVVIDEKFVSFPSNKIPIKEIKELIKNATIAGSSLISKTLITIKNGSIRVSTLNGVFILDETVNIEGLECESLSFCLSGERVEYINEKLQMSNNCTYVDIKESERECVDFYGSTFSTAYAPKRLISEIENEDIPFYKTMNAGVVINRRVLCVFEY